MKKTLTTKKQIVLNNGYIMNVEIHTPLLRKLTEEEIEKVIYILRNKTHWFEDDNGLVWGWPREKLEDLSFFKVEMKNTCWGEIYEGEEELIGGTIYTELVE